MVFAFARIDEKGRILILWLFTNTFPERTRMRQKREMVLAFAGHDDELPKTVRQYHEKYKGISAALDQVPEVLDLVHRDLLKLTEGDRRRGRSADFSSETILRALIVMTVGGLSYREAVVRIADSEFLQDFIRTRKKAVMDHTFLNKCFKAIGCNLYCALPRLAYTAHSDTYVSLMMFNKWGSRI